MSRNPYGMWRLPGRAADRYDTLSSMQQSDHEAQIRGIRDFIRARHSAARERQAVELAPRNAATPQPHHQQDLPAVVEPPRAQTAMEEQPPDEAPRGDHAPSPKMTLAVDSPGPRKLSSTHPPPEEVDGPASAPPAQPAAARPAGDGGRDVHLPQIPIPHSAVNHHDHHMGESDRHVSVLDPSVRDGRPVVLGHDDEGGEAAVEDTAAAQPESHPRPQRPRSPPPAPDVDARLSPRPAFVHVDSDSLVRHQRTAPPADVRQSRRTAAIRELLDAVNDSRDVPLSTSEVSMLQKLATDVEALPHDDDWNSAQSSAPRSPPPPVVVNSSFGRLPGGGALADAMDTSFRSFQRVTKGGGESPRSSGAGASVRTYSFGPMVGSPRNQDDQRPVAAVPGDADVQWLEAVLRFTTQCAERCGLGERPQVAKAIQNEIQAVLSVAGAAVQVWVADAATGLLINYASKQSVKIAEPSLISSAFSSGVAKREGNVAAAPMTANGTVVGVLETTFTADDKALSAGGSKPSDEEIATLADAMAAISAQFLSNATLFEDVMRTRRESDVMLRMARLLATDALEETTLVNTIIMAVSELVGADRCSVFTVGEDRKTLRAFFEDSSSFVEMGVESGIAGHVARTGETVNLQDAYSDSRFNDSVDKATGYRTRTLLCMPVSFEGKIVAVAQLVNKKSVTVFGKEVERSFSRSDEALFNSLAVFAGVCLRNCRANVQLDAQKRRNETALSVASMLSRADIRQLSKVIHQILQGAKTLLNAERASLFLVDKSRNDLYSEASFNTQGVTIRVARGKGIVGECAKTGKAINVPDAYKDPRFNKDIDRKLGYKTVSIVAEPIFSPEGEVIAVAQLINKLDHGMADLTRSAMLGRSGLHGSDDVAKLSRENSNRRLSRHASDVNPSMINLSTSSTLGVDSSVKRIPFGEDDHLAFKQFALFAGMAVSNARLLEFAVKAAEDAVRLSRGFDGSMKADEAKEGKQSRREVLENEVVTLLDVTVSDEDISAAKLPDFNLFRFRRAFPEEAVDKCARIVVQLIWETGLPVQFGCDMSTLMRFVVSCRMRYRNVPYHNWFHAVDVVQTIHHFLYTGNCADRLEPLECFVLFVVGLVHDLDHMGLNNSFHLKTDSPLGILSSASGNTSVLEVHHCNLAIEILDDPSCDVFAGLKKTARAQAIRSMIDCVLATDMAKHGDLLNQIDKTLASPDEYDVGNESHRRLAMMHITKAADISNVTKPFDVSRLWGASVTEEFYRQGDLEKDKGVDVLPMNDRSLRTELAKGQMGFINFVARKYFTVMAERLFPNLRYTVDGLEANASRWQEELELAGIAQMV